MEMRLINGTRPCIATINFRVERTDKELQKLYKDKMAEYYGVTDIEVDTNSDEYHHFCRANSSYCEKREVEAEWHMFAQETEEDSNGNIQYPVAIIELEDGTVKSVSADNIRFIKEEDGTDE